MTSPGDAPDEMTSSPRMDDDRAERLLSRRGRTSTTAHDPVGAFVAAIADLGRADPVPTGALAALLADGFEPATGRAPAPVEQSSGSRSWLTDLPLRVRVLAASGVALAGLATAATAGVLPDPVQERVGGVLEAVTPFDVPSAGEPTPPAPQDGPTGPGTGGIPVLPEAPDPPAPDLQVPEPAQPPPPAPPAPVLVPAPVTPPAPAEDQASTAPGRPAAPGASTVPPQAPGPPADAPGPDVAPRRNQRPAGDAAGVPAPAGQRSESADARSLTGGGALAPGGVTAVDPDAGRPAD